MNDVAVIGRMLRPLPMRLALIGPAVTAAAVGAADITVAWTVGWILFLTWATVIHRRRRLAELRRPIGGPSNVRVEYIDGRIVPLVMRRDRSQAEIAVFTNVGPPLDTGPRRVLVDRLPPNTAIRLRWKT